ncbi:MAG: hypothetical protein ACI8WB_000381 [Phenylobacterium sp.]
MINTAKNILDKIGIAATSLCAIHCLLLPLMLPIFPLIGASFLAQTFFERSFLAVTMVLGFFALYSGYKGYHSRLYPFAMLFAGGFIYWNKDIFGEAIEPYTVMAGATLVVMAHLVNIRLCRRYKDC